MIPQFPRFKSLEISDRACIGRYTSKYTPFSDFNFHSLWSWDLDGKVKLSMLNENLVVRFSDCETGEAYYSFLGNCEVNRTAMTLINLSKQEKIRPELKLVPEPVIAELNPIVFSAVEEASRADYVLSVDRLCNYEGPAFAAKRNDVRRFLHRSPNNRLEALDFDNRNTIARVRELFDRWYRQRYHEQPCQLYREYKAFERYLQMSPHTQLGVGVFVDQALAAFSLTEIAENGFAFTFFEKADTTGFPGVTAYLNREVARTLSLRGVHSINVEEDLGIQGLRQNKQSYVPSGFLRKFNVLCRPALPRVRAHSDKFPRHSAHLSMQAPTH